MAQRRHGEDRHHSERPQRQAPEGERAAQAVGGEGQAEPELEPPVMDLDDLSNRQFAFDSWAAADLDETSSGMPALDIPVNPLFAAAEERDSAYDNTAAYANRPSEQPRAGRIETEDYGQTSRGYSRDPFAATPAPDYNQASVKAASASSYTHGTDDERAADYHHQKAENKDAACRIGCKRVDGHQHARAHKEGAE